MKKARIMLSVIAVLAIVGGTVAFKSHSRGIPYFTGPTSGTTCTTEVPDAHTASSGTTKVLYTTVANDPCLTGYVVTGE